MWSFKESIIIYVNLFTTSLQTGRIRKPHTAPVYMDPYT